MLRIRDVYPDSPILDPTFFHPGYQIQPVSVPDPGSQIRIKEFKYFSPKKTKNKWFLSPRKYDPSCSSRIRIRMLTFYPSRIPDPGVKKAPDPGSLPTTPHPLNTSSHKTAARRPPHPSYTQQHTTILHNSTGT